MKRINFLLIIFFLIVISGCQCKKNNKKSDIDTKTFKVQTFKVKEENLVPEIKTFGTISFKSKVDILPKTTGRVEDIKVETGDFVKNGQLLATLEQFQLRIELKQAQAELNAANSNLELKKAKYDDALRGMERQFLTIEKARAELEDKKTALENMELTLNNKRKLLKEGAVSEESIRNLETQYHSSYTQHLIAERDLRIQEIGFRDKDITDMGYEIPESKEEKIKLLKKINTQTLAKEVEVAVSNFKIAKAKVDSINAYLKETYIRSPMNGIVAARYLERGEQAKTDSKLFTVMDTKSVYAKINVSESDLQRIKPNGEVEITIDALGKQKMMGKIHLINPVIDTKTRTVEISAIFDNPQTTLIPGMFVRAKIKSNEQRKAIFIPPSSLVSVEKDQADVFVVKKGIVLKKTIKLGPEENDMIEVIQGLKNDEIIVDNPQIDLVEGTRVEAQKNE